MLSFAFAFQALATQYPTLFQMQDVYEQLMSFLKQDSPFIGWFSSGATLVLTQAINAGHSS